MDSIICATPLVLWCYIDLLSIGGGGWGLSALVFVHSSICETDLVCVLSYIYG